MTTSAQHLHIAIFHNIEASGAKSAIWYFTQLLAQHGHHLDLYTLCSADEHFFSLSPFINNTHIEHVAPLRLTIPSRTAIIDQLMNTLRRLQHFHKAERAHARVAQKINHGNYDVAFVHGCMFSEIPHLLRFLNVPSIHFCHEPASRKIYEPHVVLRSSLEMPSNNSKAQSKPKEFLAKLDGISYALSEPLYNWKYRSYQRKNIHAATMVLTNSWYSRETIYRTYGIFPKVNVLGVDSTLFASRSDVPKEHMILSVGRFDPLKQHHLVIESVSHLPRHIRPEVVMIGETQNPGYIAYLEKLAGMLNVSIRIQVSANQEEIIQWYNKAKAVVFVSILEPFGLVSLEAMACKTPVIGVKEGGIRETVLHEKTGLLVDRDPKEIAEAILRILQDEAFAKKLGKKGREYVCEYWTWEKSYQQLIKHFQSVLG